MLQQLLGWRSLLWIESQHQPYELLGVTRDGVPFWRREVELTSLHTPQNVLVPVPIEWGEATKEDVRHYPAAPDVALLIVVPQQHLGGDVVRRAGLGLQELLVFGREVSRQAEVYDLEVRIGGLRLQEEVLGLDVTVHVLALVKVVHRTKDLAHVNCCAAFIKSLHAIVLIRLLNDAIEELAPCAQLHHEVVLLRIFEDLMELHNVGVVKLLLDPHLLLESARVGDPRDVDDLDGPLDARGLVHALADQAVGALAHVALAQLVVVVDAARVLLGEHVLEVDRCGLAQGASSGRHAA
mmetsp:Transcript_83619/g.270570  ORF Transcript_83619/g.270570 Transcript_83619/m.270570 type:complete len:296 (-) Transcript_83619:96-983(-)